MCGCGDLKYARRNHSHKSYVTQATVDAAVADLQAQIDDLAAEVEPIGTVKLWVGTFDPAGGKWVICDGRTLNQFDYSELYAIVGDTFGYDSSNFRFNVPNFGGRVAIGTDVVQTEFDVVGRSGGEKKHTLTVAEMPTHNHSTSPGYFIARDTVSGTIGVIGGNVFSQGTMNNAGSSVAHNNLQPYLVLNYIIKVK